MKRSKVKQAQYNRQHRIYKYKVIRQFHEERGWSIKDMCSILKISRASYYKWLNKKPMEDKNSLLIKQIQEISEKNNRLFGYRKMTMKINKISEKPVNHKRIYRLMSLLDLQSVYRPRKRYPKNANKQQTAKNVLKRQFETSKPNEVWVTDITEIAKAVEGAGADALSLINTIRGMRIDVNTRRPILRMNTGGLSGPAVLPVAVRMVWEVSQAVSLPILGMGGVSKGEDGAQLMLAGASAVAVGTALFADPFAPLKVRDGLAEIAARQGLSAVSELTGGVKPW